MGDFYAGVQIGGAIFGLLGIACGYGICWARHMVAERLRKG